MQIRLCYNIKARFSSTIQLNYETIALLNPERLFFRLIMKICSINGCFKDVQSRDLCSMHYRRFRRDDSLPLISIEDRFWKYVNITDFCWEWGATIDRKGYPTLLNKGRIKRAHRLSYEISIGPIPGNLGLDHLCRNTICVNPDHLEAVSSPENTRRARKNEWYFNEDFEVI